MNIALDYDGTFTNDPELWLLFVLQAQHHDHTVAVVTMRYPSEGASMDPRLAALGVKTIFTSRLAKLPAALAQGFTAHVWIDDHPMAVHMDADQIWPNPAPEGSPVVPEVPA